MPIRPFFALYFLPDDSVLSFEIWNTFKENFCQGFLGDNQNRALLEIDGIFKLENRRYSDFRFPELDEHISGKCIAQLNVDQKFIFDFIMKESRKINHIHGPGDTGKTLLCKALIHYFLEGSNFKKKRQFYVLHN